jgi:adenosylhomocysteine nucleosidase
MIGIIGAMEDEVELLRSRMVSAREETIGGFAFITGTLRGKEVVLVRCGIGKVNAAIGTTLLIDRYHSSLVINSGSAGGIDKTLVFGDAVIAEGLIYHDVDVTVFGYAAGQVPGQNTIFHVESRLIALAEAAVDELKKEGVLPASMNHTRGLVGSADAFMSTDEQIDKLRNIFPAIKAVEMEGAAIAHTAVLFGVPFLVIRALSDIAGAESPMKFDEFLPLAAKHSAEIVMRIIEKQ